MHFCRFNLKFESLNRVRVHLEPWGFRPGFFIGLSYSNHMKKYQESG
jgi:hypothetical protein